MTRARGLQDFHSQGYTTILAGSRSGVHYRILFRDVASETPDDRSLLLVWSVDQLMWDELSTLWASEIGKEALSFVTTGRPVYQDLGRGVATGRRVPRAEGISSRLDLSSNRIARGVGGHRERRTLLDWSTWSYETLFLGGINGVYYRVLISVRGEIAFIIGYSVDDHHWGELSEAHMRGSGLDGFLPLDQDRHHAWLNEGAFDDKSRPISADDHQIVNLSRVPATLALDHISKVSSHRPSITIDIGFAGPFVYPFAFFGKFQFNFAKRYRKTGEEILAPGGPYSETLDRIETILTGVVEAPK